MNKRNLVKTGYRTLFPKNSYTSELNLERCSLRDYIGVRWAVDLPLTEHYGFAKDVYFRFANALNDTAAKEAFELLIEVCAIEVKCRYEKVAEVVTEYHSGMSSEELAKRREIDSRNTVLSRHIEAEVHGEVLALINSSFALPHSFNDEREEKTNCTFYTVQIDLLVELRKQMIRNVISNWKSVPGNTNDELSFQIICSMFRLGVKHNHSQSPVKDAKSLIDMLLEELRMRVVLNANACGPKGVTGFDWKYWLTVNPAAPEPILDTIAMARTKIGGYKQLLADIG
jgi:hypothetical protein